MSTKKIENNELKGNTYFEKIQYIKEIPVKIDAIKIEDKREWLNKFQ